MKICNRKIWLCGVWILFMFCMLAGCAKEEVITPKAEYILPQYAVLRASDFEMDYGTYYNENGILKFRDRKSKKEVVVSNTPDQTEENDKNPAYIGFANFVFVNEDTLYTVDRGMQTEKVRIETSGLDRTNIKEIFSTEGIQVWSYVRMDNQVYFFVSGPEKTENPDTGIEEYSDRGKSELFTLNLDTNEVQSTSLICSGEATEAMLIGAEDETVYYVVAGIENEDYVNRFFRFNIKDKTTEELYQVTGKRVGDSYVKDNKIVYKTFEDAQNTVVTVHSYDMESKNTEELELTEELEELFWNFGREQK